MKYNYVYKTRLSFSGKEAYYDEIVRNKIKYNTGYFTQNKELTKESKWILINNPERAAALALDKLIIKNGLNVPLQILKSKEK